MSQRDDALAALTEMHHLAVVHAGTACWKAIQKHMPLLKAAIEEPFNGFTKLATLIEDIKIDRYGKPLIAALHLCNDLANDLDRATPTISEQRMLAKIKSTWDDLTSGVITKDAQMHIVNMAMIKHFTGRKEPCS